MEQLNWIVFQVGIVTTDPQTKLEVVTTAGIHPLVVKPRSIKYSDSSRTSVVQTMGGTAITKGGRALRSITMDGTFGVETRGLVGYVGTGDVRFRRFYNEVVRLSDALSSDDVQSCIDLLSGTPAIQALVSPFQADRSVFFINFFDFWHGISCRIEAVSFDWEIGHQRGGASGLRHYNLRMQEAGPIREGGTGTEILAALMTILGTWDALNQAIASYTTTALLDSTFAGADVLVGQLSNTLEAVADQLQSVQALMGASQPLATTPGAVGTASFFANVTQMMQQARRIAEVLPSPDFEAPRGRVADDTTGSAALDTAETQGALGDLLDAADFQLSAGVFFGQDRWSFRSWIASGGLQGVTPPNVGSSRTYYVRPADTPWQIEVNTGANWAQILEANGLTPDEALLNGRALQIPQARPKGPPGLNGVATFGSHLGEAIWGLDLPLELEASTAGDLATVSSATVLEQGATFLIEQAADDLLREIGAVPPEVQSNYLAQRLSKTLLSDARIVGIENVTVVQEAVGLSIDIRCRAINGGEVTLGAQL